MADLDDFFAKKDKKGGKKGAKAKKGISNDDLEKKFDDKSETTFKMRKFTNLDSFQVCLLQFVYCEFDEFNVCIFHFFAGWRRMEWF